MAEAIPMVLGWDHHRTPLRIRERLAVDYGDLGPVLDELIEIGGGDEVVMLNTCNRTECYLAGDVDEEACLRHLAQVRGLDVGELRRLVYRHHGAGAVRHCFRVAASLESMVLGEYQIIHQVKRAYEVASRHGLTGTCLDPLFQRTLAVAAEVRNATAIGGHKVSVASVAVDLARQILGNLSRQRLLVVGAGEIAELAVVHFLDAGIGELTVVNRGRDRAESLLADRRIAVARPRMLPWEDLGRAMSEHEVIVTSTAAQLPIVTRDEVRKLRLGARKPVMFLDLAVPRDVDAAVGDLDNLFVYNIDDLDHVVAGNRTVREEDLREAEALIDDKVDGYLAQRRVNATGIMEQAAGLFEEVIAAESERLVGKLPDADPAAIREAMQRLGNKVRHRILAYLRQRGGDPDAERAVREIFDLDREDGREGRNAG